MCDTLGNKNMKAVELGYLKINGEGNLNNDF